MRRIMTIFFVLVMTFALSACQLYSSDFQAEVLEYALIATDGSDLAVLDQYPTLEYVDLRGSTCYADVMEYINSHPNVKVRFTIALGEQNFNQDVTDLTLSGKDAVFEDLLNNLQYFPALKSLHIDEIRLTGNQLNELQKKYPHIDLTYTVKIGESVFDSSVSELNISQLTSLHVDDAVTSLGLFPNLTQVDLVNSAGGTNLTVSNAKALMEAYPHLNFNYQFRLFGQTLSTETETVTYTNTAIGNTGLDQLREAMAVMPNCTYICLDNCKIDNEALAQFRSDYPDVKIVWRVFVDKYSVLTDTEVILMQNTVNDQEVIPLKYCTNVKYLDLSGCKISKFDFLSNMPNLECAVFQRTYISDLSVLQGCSNLTWLDLSSCTALKSISELSALSNLKYLNLSSTKIKELSPLDQIPLERFKCAKTSIPENELDAFTGKHPNCLTTTKGTAGGMGWRYDDAAQKVPCEYYKEMIKAFGYAK